MSINDPQWGNSHRPERKDPDSAPESTGEEPMQPGAEQRGPGEPVNGARTEKSNNDQPVDPTGRPSPGLPPPEGPPDLEVLWQQWLHGIRTRFARLTGRPLPPAPKPVQVPVSVAATSNVPGAAGNTPQGASVPGVNWQALSWQSWTIGVALIIGAWLMSGFYLVDANQRGVLSRFGAIVGTEDPGWHWRWPYPVESVRLINVVNERTLDVGGPGMADGAAGAGSNGLMLTSDRNLLGLEYRVTYQITDPVAYMTLAEVPAELLSLQSEEVLRQAVSTQPLLVWQRASAKPEDFAKSDVMQRIREQLQAAQDTLKTGLHIKSLQISNVRMPTPVVQMGKQAVRDAQKEERLFRETQAASADQLIKSRQLANQVLSEGMAYANAVASAVTPAGDAGQTERSEALIQWTQLQDALRQQYPLVFMSPAQLMARVTGVAPAKNTTGVPVSDKSSGEGASAAPGSASGAWRDRELMRSRDRVDRPGTGS